MTFRIPGASITWLHFLRSRWLLAGTDDGRLKVFDLLSETAKPITDTSGLSGSVSSGVCVEAEAKVSITVGTT